jgi:hypothetical protein
MHSSPPFLSGIIIFDCENVYQLSYVTKTLMSFKDITGKQLQSPYSYRSVMENSKLEEFGNTLKSEISKVEFFVCF